MEDLAAACGERDGEEYDWRELQEGPPEWLGEPVEVSRRNGAGHLDRLPTSDELAAWHEALLEGGPQLDYLLNERGLVLETIEEHQIGYVESGAPGAWSQFGAFTFPVETTYGMLVNLRKRFWPRAPVNRKGKPTKIVGLAGCGSQLYPDVPEGSRLLVCEGELDALLARVHGFPAVTSTAGTSWKPDWDYNVEGKHVAVIYDVGARSLELARKRAAGFVAAGAKSARAVDLRRAGLRRKKDVTDFFVTHEKAADELRRLINTTRKEAA